MDTQKQNELLVRPFHKLASIIVFSSHSTGILVLRLIVGRGSSSTTEWSLGVDRGDNDVIGEMKEQDGKAGKEQKQAKPDAPKDSVGGQLSVFVVVKALKENQILVGDNQEDAQQEPNRKGGGESFEYICSNNPNHQMQNPHPNGNQQVGRRSFVGLFDIHHCRFETHVLEPTLQTNKTE